MLRALWNSVLEADVAAGAREAGLHALRCAED
jgi:hypothetical protein